jgi:type II secretory pathway component PulF
MTSPTPPPLPSAGRRISVTLLAALPWPLVLFQFVTILDGYDKLFRQFHLQLDSFTALLLNISAWVRRHLELAFGIAVVLTIVSMLIVHTIYLAPVRRNRRVAILTFVFGVPCAVFVLAWVGVLGTHSRLVEGLNK